MRLVSFSLAGAHTSLIFGIKLGIPPGAAIALIRLAGLVHRWQASRLPLLANELNIVQREMHLGQSAGEALQHFADRGDLEELRSLASVITQSEKFGASLVKALRTHADTLRGKRLQYAEEMAQKAAIKILFPTIFCIFPGLFLVILGPAAMQVLGTLASLRQ